MYRGGLVTTTNEVRRGELGILIKHGWLARMREEITGLWNLGNERQRTITMRFESKNSTYKSSSPGIGAFSPNLETYMRHERTRTFYYTYDPPVGLFAM
jgi:hypothetical protein